MSEPTPPTNARVAIVHDWLAGMYGAEQVVSALLEQFSPTPDLYTFHAAHARLDRALSAAVTQESRLAALPGLRERGDGDGRWRWLLPLMPHYFESLDLRGHDLVISSSHACAAGARPPAGTPHLVYCYTPMRYAWMPDAERGRFSALETLGMRALRGRLRDWDRRAAARPTAYIAISTAVAERIAACYGREARVIHPPVAVEAFAGPGEHDPTRFLWVNRFVAYKRPLEVLHAFAELPELHLTMVGVGPLRDAALAHIAEQRITNVEVHGWLERERLTQLYRSCGAFIHLGEEDFGISMVEAQGAGLPVLAIDAGGARDIVEEASGVLIAPTPSPTQVAAAARALAQRPWDRDAIRARAARFSPARFHREIAEVVSATLARSSA